MSTFVNNDVSSGAVVLASDHNTMGALIAAVVNGGLDNSNLASGAGLTADKIADDAITAPKVSGLDKSNLTTDSNPYKFFAYRNAALNCGATAILFDTELYDTNSNYDPATGRYTIPVDGFYIFSAACPTTFASAGRAIGVLIYKNGSQYLGSVIVTTYTLSFSEGQPLTTPPISLVAGDYIQALPVNQSGDPFVVGSSPIETFFGGYLMCRT